MELETVIFKTYELKGLANLTVVDSMAVDSAFETTETTGTFEVMEIGEELSALGFAVMKGLLVREEYILVAKLIDAREDYGMMITGQPGIGASFKCIY